MILQRTRQESELSHQEFNLITKQLFDMSNHHNTLINDLKTELMKMVEEQVKIQEQFQEKEDKIMDLTAELTQYKETNAKVNSILDSTILMNDMYVKTSELYINYKLATDDLIKNQQDEIQKLKSSRLSMYSMPNDTPIRVSDDKYITMMEDNNPRVSLCTRIMSLFKC